MGVVWFFFFFQAQDGIRDRLVTGVRTCALPIFDQVADAPGPIGGSIPDRLREFDDKYTAPVSGFEGVYDYYSHCSGAQFVPAINVPTLILTARDDPLIAVTSFEQLPAVPAVQVHIAEHGGHLGYIARPGVIGRNFRNGSQKCLQ